jgi:hypothetical protein
MKGGGRVRACEQGAKKDAMRRDGLRHAGAQGDPNLEMVSLDPGARLAALYTWVYTVSGVNACPFVHDQEARLVQLKRRRPPSPARSHPLLKIRIRALGPSPPMKYLRREALGEGSQLERGERAAEAKGYRVRGPRASMVTARKRGKGVTRVRGREDGAPGPRAGGPTTRTAPTPARLAPHSPAAPARPSRPPSSCRHRRVRPRRRRPRLVCDERGDWPRAGALASDTRDP